LERLDALMRAAPQIAGGAALDDASLAALGWSADEAARILRGLGFTPARRGKAAEPVVWRRRKPPSAPAPRSGAASPFAVLATLAPSAAAAAPRRKRRRVRKAS
jgi:hypothetical protein